MGQPGLFFVYFRSFSNKHQYILQQINVKKCPSSIWHWDWNPQPSERESPPITTRPGLPPYNKCYDCGTCISWMHIETKAIPAKRQTLFKNLILTLHLLFTWIQVIQPPNFSIKNVELSHNKSIFKPCLGPGYFLILSKTLWWRLASWGSLVLVTPW